MTSGFGEQALISLMSHLIFVGLAFWALQSIHFEKWLKPNRVTQARLLLLLVSIALGSAVSNFFLDYLQWSQQLRLLGE